MTGKMASTEQIHNRLLEMAKAIANILEKHNIPYSLAYGSLLGAIRHQGFIPWDEDLDLWLFDDSYEKASEVLRQELPQDMFLEDLKSEPKYFHAWAHVKDLRSVVRHSMFVHDDSYSHKGLSIDLYRLWKVKECEVENFLNVQNRKYIMRRRELSLMSDAEYKGRMDKLEENERKAKSNQNESQENVYALLNPYKCKKIYEKYVFPLKKYKFEDFEFYGMNEAQTVLRDLYGDWQTPTPVEKRESHTDSVLFLD